MPYTKTPWKDRVVEKPMTFTMQNNEDGTITLIPAEGQIVEPGTPLTAAYLNNLETQYDQIAAIAQMYKLTKDTGWSFLTADLPIETTSFNQITNRGSYYCGNGLTEHPFGSGGTANGHLEVIVADNTNIIQRWTNIAGRTLTRGLYNSTWSPWKELTSNAAPTWGNLTLQNGWINSGGNDPVAQYTKIGNIVFLKGVIKSGTATSGTTLFTLPSGFRPNQRVYITTISNSALTRLLIYPTDGTVAISGIASNTWLQIDACFAADGN
jgi:hypothetical protein